MVGNPSCFKCKNWPVGKYIGKWKNQLLFFCWKHGFYTTGAGPQTFEVTEQSDPYLYSVLMDMYAEENGKEVENGE